MDINYENSILQMTDGNQSYLDLDYDDDFYGELQTKVRMY